MRVRQVEKPKKIQLKYIVIACVLAVGSIYGIYRLYAKDDCQRLMLKRDQYIRNGEVFIQLKDMDGTPGQYVKRDIFLSMCMAEKFRV